MEGEDSDGTKYSDVTDLWAGLKKDSWYSKAQSYWEGQEANLNGVLGGFPETNGPDIRESQRFLDLVRRAEGDALRVGSVLDAGAGIGRVTSGFLLNAFQQVDLLEPNSRLLETARKEIKDPRAERFIESSLQDFEPEPGRYDVIWAQWVLLYLTDDDLNAFLGRCIKALRPGGWIFVKENVVLEGNWVVDKCDNSISRTDQQYKEVFKRAHLILKHELKQACWPSDLIPVKMYALRPE